MGTKYIVNNVSGQTIDGNITINGNFIVTGSSTTNGLGIYRALLTQTGSITGTTILDFNYGLIIGETYTITNYVAVDDFSNIADVQSGNINETGCVFIATGENPISYNNGTELVSSGNLVVDVIENSLGYNIIWTQSPFGGYGYYIGVRDDLNSYYNSFQRNNVSVFTNLTNPFDWGLPFLSIISDVESTFSKDDTIVVSVLDWDNSDTIDNALYYTPIEIIVKNDTTPIQISGLIDTTFPYSYPRYNLSCNGIITANSFYSGDPTTVNNVAELVTLLNNNNNTNVLGPFSEDGQGGIILTMETDIKQRYCQDGVLTFTLFND